MSERTIKGLATLLRNGGNPYQEFRMFLLKPEEAKEYADLLDPPPRFNEAQMAFWRGWYAIGARHACHMIDIDRVYMFDGSGAFPKVQLLSTTVDTGLKKGETLDLAELFGKDGAEC